MKTHFMGTLYSKFNEWRHRINYSMDIQFHSFMISSLASITKNVLYRKDEVIWQVSFDIQTVANIVYRYIT